MDVGAAGRPPTECGRPDAALQPTHVLPVPAMGTPLGPSPWGHLGASIPTCSALAGLTISIPFVSFIPLGGS